MLFNSKFKFKCFTAIAVHERIALRRTCALAATSISIILALESAGRTTEPNLAAEWKLTNLITYAVGKCNSIINIQLVLLFKKSEHC